MAPTDRPAGADEPVTAQSGQSPTDSGSQHVPPVTPAPPLTPPVGTPPPPPGTSSNDQPANPPIKPWSGATTWPAQERPVGPRRSQGGQGGQWYQQPPPGATRRSALPCRPRDLRSQWTVWLAYGAVACLLLSLLRGLDSFPTWLVGAGAGLACSFAAIVIGAIVSLDANATRTRAPEATASLIVSALLGLLAICVIGLSIAEYGPLRDYASCMRGANTITAQNQCQVDFVDRVGNLGGTLPDPR